MSNPYLGEIRLLAFAFAPKGWALCQGQLLPINQNQALFALLGTQYGGNGTTTFALPDLQGRTPMHVGFGFPQGAVGGEASHALTAAEMPSHTHAIQARVGPPTGSPAGATWTRSPHLAFVSTPTVAMAATAVQPTGGGQPHDNMPPYLVMSYAIALQGIFPSRS